MKDRGDAVIVVVVVDVGVILPADGRSFASVGIFPAMGSDYVIDGWRIFSGKVGGGTGDWHASRS